GNWQWSKDDDQQQQQPIRVTSTNNTTTTTRHTKKDGDGVVESSVVETITDNNNQVFERASTLVRSTVLIMTPNPTSFDGRGSSWPGHRIGDIAEYNPPLPPPPPPPPQQQQQQLKGVITTVVAIINITMASLPNLGNLTPADQAMVNKEMQDMQVNESLQTYNGLVERCFNQCIQNFRAKNLDYEETDCVKRCVGKFMTYSQRVGTRFAEKNQQVAQDQQAAAAAATASAGHP
ncbi:Mitochondrial import inner membrane translocase subunit Tim9, partial [Perkinsus olseni]